MKVHRTAGITAVWRHMAKVDPYALNYVNSSTFFFGYILGMMDLVLL
jgi:hypothetical protein